MEVPASAHALYSLDPKDFVTARDLLAKKLRDEDEKEEAKLIKALRRPTIPVWALNQVARERPDQVNEVVAASSEAQAAKDKDIRDALARRRDRLHDVMVSARQIIEGSGRSPDTHELDLTSALSTILASDRLTQAFRDGVLTEVTDESAAIEWPDVSGVPPPRGPSAELVRAREELERRRVAAEDAASRMADAERLLAVAQQALAKAEQEVARLEA
ncbi:MAG TPA: hypothetical protein VHI95_09640 [Acidimicrobiales bacterium]|nr:hypothetical protein [Acidimicrobiales bacterium]